jgi:hypothetical protein
VTVAYRLKSLFVFPGNNLQQKKECRVPLSSPLLNATPAQAYAVTSPTGSAYGQKAATPRAIVSIQPQPAKPDHPPNVMRDTPLRFWGYVNEVAEAFAPQIRHAFGKGLHGKDWVNHWSYTVVDWYAQLDALFTTIRTWRQDKDRKGFDRLWHAGTEGMAEWLFQLMASVYLPATVVSGVRKGMYQALNPGAMPDPVIPKHALAQALHYLEDATRLTTYSVVKTAIKMPGAGQLLAQPWVKKQLLPWIPGLVATATIPLVIKPIDAFSQRVVDTVVKPPLSIIGAWLKHRSPVTERLKKSVNPRVSKPQVPRQAVLLPHPVYQDPFRLFTEQPSVQQPAIHTYSTSKPSW